MNVLLSLDGLFWLMLALLALIFLQRILHREIQAFFLILTRNPGVTQVIFALIFFPGVLLHELSHFITAKLLGIRTGRFSLIPKPMPNGRLRLGYVETASGGVVRDALVGLAPLITGCLFVAYAAINPMHMLPLWNVLRGGNFPLFWMGLGILPTLKDFWLWFYFTFVISSTMMPSASDRHAWMPVGIFAGVLITVALLAGAGPWMLEHLAPSVNSFFNSLALIFGLSAVMHAIFIVPFFLLHRLISGITHVDIGR